jgi:hypothetical protein
MQKWEYTFTNMELNGFQVFHGKEKRALYEYLKFMGIDGWELAGTMPAQQYEQYILIFKRPIEYK